MCFTPPTPSTLHRKGPAEGLGMRRYKSLGLTQPVGGTERAGSPRWPGGVGGVELRGGTLRVTWASSCGGSQHKSEYRSGEAECQHLSPQATGSWASGWAENIPCCPPTARMGFPSAKGRDEPTMSRGGL